MPVLRTTFAKALAAALAGLSLLISVDAMAEDRIPARPSWYASSRISDLKLEDPAYRNLPSYQALRRRYESKLADARTHPEKAGTIASELWSELSAYPLFTDAPQGQEDAKLGLHIYAEIVAIWERQHPEQNTRDGTRFIQGTPTATQDASNTSTVTGFSDPYGSGPVDEILRGATTGSFINSFFPSKPAGSTSTGTGTATDTSTSTRTDTGARTSTGGKSASNESDITGTGGVSSRYVPITKEAARDIVGKYKSIPGGITLQAGISDFSFVKKVTYSRKANAFIINDDLVYLNPVSGSEYFEIEAALSKDDRLGVSLGEYGVQIIYGALRAGTAIAWNLLVADKLFGEIVFGRANDIGYKALPGYQKRAHERNLRSVAVHFNFSEYRLAEAPGGELRRADVQLSTTLVPLLIKKGSDGGHLPDFDRIERGDLQVRYVANLKHLQENINYYAREKIIRLTMAYGEVAAFARSLKTSNVKAELD